MKSLYSYKNQEPTELPFRIHLDDGSTRTSLSELDSQELESLGFVGPITKPIFDENTQKLNWNGVDYVIVPLTQEEIVLKEKYNQKSKPISYDLFWYKLSISKFYKKLRIEASQSLTSNTILTELVASLSDAKSGKVNSGVIQNYIDIIFLNFQFEVDEVEELKSIMEETNLSSVYQIPDEEFLSSHIYDMNSNTVVCPPDFPSWTLVDGAWQAPVPTPNPPENYKWDEELGNWVEI